MIQQRIDPIDAANVTRFVSLHDLARDCDVRQKNIWYRLRKLMAKGALKPGVDYFTENYVDPLHFEWKVDPLRYLELSPRHRASFENRQRRLQSESEVEAIVHADAPTLASESPSKETPTARKRGSSPPVEEGKGSDPVLEKLLDQIDHQNGTIRDLQTTIREMSTSFQEFGRTLHTMTEENVRLVGENRGYHERLLQLGSPRQEDGLSA